MKQFILVVLSLAVLQQGGCRTTQQPQSIPIPGTDPRIEVVKVKDVGPLRFLKVIRGRDGGFSALFGNRSVWVFGDTPLNFAAEDSSRWRSSTWCQTEDLDANDGIQNLLDPVDANGAPGEFLPFTEEELKYNQVHNRMDVVETERSRWALWPGPIVIDPVSKKAYVFYSKIYSKVGAWNFEGIGSSIAVWESPEGAVIRPKVGVLGEDSMILFPKGDVTLGYGAVGVDDWLYAYGGERKGLVFPCMVGRVKLSDVLNRNSWQFFAGNDRWSSDWKDAIPVLDAAPMLTVHWNQYLGKYLAVYSEPLVNNISIRTADRPEGPWSNSQVVVQCKPPTNKEAWTYGGMAHPEFTKENGRIEYFTYCWETGFLKSEIRLVELSFR